MNLLFGRTTRYETSVMVVAAILVLAGDLPATPYEITVVADTTVLPAYETLRAASISNRGTVAFVATAPAPVTGRETLFAYRDGRLVTLADTNDGYYRRIWYGADFNDSDEVAFPAEVAGVGEAILVHNGTSARQLYPSVSAPYTYLREPPSINNAGLVTFRSIPPGSLTTSGAYVGDGVTTRTLAEQSQPFGGVSVPDINNLGQVAYRVATSPNQIYVDTNGVQTLIAQGGSVPFRGGLNDPVINDRGVVAFVGYDGFEGAGRSGVYVGSGGPVTVIADSSGPFGSFGPYVGINGLNQVAFLAWVDGGGFERGGGGIYTGPDLLRDKVIAEGDVLGESFVTRLYFYSAINDAGQIAFEYDLANGTRGIAVATPVPEPSGAAALALVAVPLLCRRRGRGRQSGSASIAPSDSGRSRSFYFCS